MRGWRRRVLYARAPCGANARVRDEGQCACGKAKAELVRCGTLLRIINGYRRHNVHCRFVCPGVLCVLSFIQARHLSVPRPGGGGGHGGIAVLEAGAAQGLQQGTMVRNSSGRR